MNYRVSIKYTGPATELPTSSMPICSLFQPGGSYVDSTAYDGTRFDANVPGFGMADFEGGYAQTLALAMFKLAILNSGSENAVVFDVTDHKEVAYYVLMGKTLADQGFEVTVTNEEDVVGDDTEGA